jgi:hypothetical protein
MKNTTVIANGIPSPEQHHAEEGRLKQKRGEAFVAQERSLDGPGALREHAPVGAELEGHHDAADHAHGERQREDPQPKIEHSPVHWITGRETHPLDRGEPSREPDRKGGEDDVEADDERKLQSG